MHFFLFIKDQAAGILVNASGMLLLGYYLCLTGTSAAEVFLILTVWTVVLLIWGGIRFYSRKKYFDRIFLQLEALDQPYLIGEVMEPSWRLEDRLYREIIRKSNKSVIEKIHACEDAGKEYKEYIESWIHEVKTPLTAMGLLLENCRENPVFVQKLKKELRKVENQVELVLYYARSERVYQDYLIHPIDLRRVLIAALQKNRPYFMEAGIQISMELPEDEPVCVSTDEKWVEFLLNQVFSNCIKYRNRKNPVIRIDTKKEKNSLLLSVWDNGIGIPKEDLGRIFDKGFTGANGRREKATGIGLYLCRKLCGKLDIGLTCESERGTYTRITFRFPDSGFYKPS